MATASQFTNIARALDGVTETVACAGTAIEQASFKVGKKSFLFVQAKDGGVIVRLKLGESASSAGAHEAVEIGVNGWATVRLSAQQALPRAARAWVLESYALSGGGVAKKPRAKPATKKPATKKAAAKKPATKKRATRK